MRKKLSIFYLFLLVSWTLCIGYDDFRKFSIVLYTKLPCRESFRSEMYCLEFEPNLGSTRCISVNDMSPELDLTEELYVIAQKEFVSDYDAYRFIFKLYDDPKCVHPRNESNSVFETNCFELNQRLQKHYPGLRVFRECVEQTSVEIYVEFVRFKGREYMLSIVIVILTCFCCVSCCHCVIIVVYLYSNARVHNTSRRHVVRFLLTTLYLIRTPTDDHEYIENETPKKEVSENNENSVENEEENVADSKEEIELKEVEIQSSESDKEEEEEGGEEKNDEDSTNENIEEIEDESENQSDESTAVNKISKNKLSLSLRSNISSIDEDIPQPTWFGSLSTIGFILIVILLSPTLFCLGVGSICGLALLSPCWDILSGIVRPLLYRLYVGTEWNSYYFRYGPPIFHQPCRFYVTKVSNIFKSTGAIVIWSVKNSIELLLAVLAVAKLKEEINDPQHIEVWLWNRNIQLTVQVMIVFVILLYSLLISINVSYRFTSTFQACVFISAFKEYFYFRMFQVTMNLLGIVFALYVAFYQGTFDYDSSLTFQKYTLRVAGFLVPIGLLVIKIAKVLIWRGVGASALMVRYKHIRPMESMLIPDPSVSLRRSLLRDPDEITQYVIIALSLLLDEKIGYEMEENDYERQIESGLGKKQFCVKEIFRNHQRYQYLFWDGLDHLTEEELMFLRELIVENRVLNVGNYLEYHHHIQSKLIDSRRSKSDSTHNNSVAVSEDGDDDEGESDEENERKESSDDDDGEKKKNKEKEQSKEDDEHEKIRLEMEKERHPWFVNERDITTEAPLPSTTTRFCFRSPITGFYIKSFFCHFCSRGVQRLDKDTRMERRMMKYSMEAAQAHRKQREHTIVFDVDDYENEIELDDDEEIIDDENENVLDVLDVLDEVEEKEEEIEGEGEEDLKNDDVL